MIAGACLAVQEETGLHAVALSGGVFQNRLLLRLCDQTLQHLASPSSSTARSRPTTAASP